MSKKIRMFQAWLCWQAYNEGFTLLNDYTSKLMQPSQAPPYFGINSYPEKPCGETIIATINNGRININLIPNN